MALPLPSTELPGVSRLASLAEGGAQIASLLEAGQARLPLTEALRAAADERDPSPLRVLLCGLSPEAVARTLSHLLGHDYNFCKVVVPRRIGYTEVRLQERGFVLEADTTREEFDALDPFLRALEERDLVQAGNPDSWMNPRRLGLSAPADSHGLSLLIPDSLQSLVKRPALLSLLADQADWVIVAGEKNDVLPVDARQLLQILADSTGGLCSVVLPSGDRTVTTSRWWEGWKPESSVPPLLLADGHPAKAVVLPGTGGVRTWLRASRRAREIEGALSLLGEQVRQQIQMLQNKRRLQDEGLVVRPGMDMELRKLGETLRARVQQDLDSVVATVEDQMRQALLPGGALASVCQRAVSELQPGDLDQSTEHAIIQLRLGSAAEERLREFLIRETHSVLLSHLETVHEAVETTTRETSEVLSKQLGRSIPLACEALDAGRLWENVSRLARPEIRYKGEMPRTTWWMRVMAARQIAFGVVMMGMVLSGVATMIGGSQGSSSLRTGLYLLVLPLFLGGFLYTFVSFRKKEEQLLSKEIEKLRDGVGQELKRVGAELLRETGSQLKSFLARVTRDLSESVNARLREHEEREVRRSEQNRTQAQEMARSLDGRLRQLATHDSEVKKLLVGVADVRTKLRDARKTVLAVSS